MRVIIDRFEGEYAIVEIELGKYTNIPNNIFTTAPATTIAILFHTLAFENEPSSSDSSSSGSSSKSISLYIVYHKQKYFQDLEENL